MRKIIYVAREQSFIEEREGLKLKNNSDCEEKCFHEKILDIANALIVSIDKNQIINYINKRGAELLECPFAEIIGKNWFDNFIPENKRKELKNLFNELMNRDIIDLPIYLENEIQTAAGKIRIVSWSNTVMRDCSGKINGIISSGEDISDRIYKEKLLKKNEMYFRSIVDASADVIYKHNLDGIITFASPSAKNMLGYDSEYFIGKNIFSEIIHPDDAGKISKVLENLKKGKPQKNVEIKLESSERGVYKIFSANAIPIFSIETGEVEEIQGILRDITDLKNYNKTLEADVDKRTKQLEKIANEYKKKITELQQKEKELREKQTRLEFLTDSFELIIQIAQKFLFPVDFEKKFNQSLEEIGKHLKIENIYYFTYQEETGIFDQLYVWNYKYGDNPVKKYFNLHYSVFPTVSAQLMNNRSVCFDSLKLSDEIREPDFDFLNKQNIASEFVFPRFIEGKFGGFVVFFNACVKNWTEEEKSILIICSEILNSALNSKLKKEEFQNKMLNIFQTERLATLGTLIAGIAHEINNPNTLLTLNIPTLEKYCSVILPVVEEHLAATGSAKIGKFEVSELKDDIHSIMSSLKIGSDRIQKIIETLKEFSSQSSDELIQQINVEDVINKSYTIAGATIRKSGAVIKFEIEPDIVGFSGRYIEIEQLIVNMMVNSAHALQNRENPEIKISASRTATHFRLCFMDNGSGIESNILTRIFDPFYTTKQSSGGTGLGLSIVYNIIKKHKGAILPISETNRGTIFIIDFPLDTVSGLNLKTELKPLVLLIDDEKDITFLTQSYLRKKNIESIILNSPEKITDVIANNPNIDIIISDLIMPNFDGFNLTALILKKYPWIKTFCLSNHQFSKNEIIRLQNNGV
ncbi:MAG TPA: PAS domain S-box protein, partial [bacterium]|nr:PAS domain S-box protein [bacterium]